VSSARYTKRAVYRHGYRQHGRRCLRQRHVIVTCIRLLAAFSGQHIFIDPDPADSDAAFNERKRLFELRAPAGTIMIAA